MSEEDLELLITLDDPGDPLEEDIFNHLHANTIDRGPCKVTFGQGDWTCTLSRPTGTTGDSMKGMNIEVCTVTHWKSGEIVEQKLFYDLVAMNDHSLLL